MSNNNISWTEKYKPTKISDISFNLDKINKIKDWLINLKTSKLQNNIIISGCHGIGKNSVINILLNNTGYISKILSSNNVKNKKSLDEIINISKKKYNVSHILTNYNNCLNNPIALIIDDTETISLTNEKNSLIELCKNNNVEKILPIIFIANNHHCKFKDDLKKVCIEYIFDQPKNTDLLIIMKKIMETQNIKINDIKVINSIINYTQYDIRRLIIILQDIYLTYNNVEIDQNKLRQYFCYSQKKDIEISLFDATKNILNNIKSINEYMDMYEANKILLPLMIYENYFRCIFAKQPIKSQDNKTSLLLKQLDVGRRICNSTSKGDVIETNIFTDQNWMNQCIQGFYTICDNSHTINSVFDPLNYKTNYYNIEFSLDLNKTSLKNINRKNITGLQKIFINKSLDDIMYINKLVYSLVKKNKIKEA